MNKVVLTTLAMSAVLILSGCSTSGSSGYGHKSYSSSGSCATCGPGSSAVQHGHNRGRVGGGSGSGGSIAAIVGGVALLALLFSAIDDDDGDDK